MKGGNDHFWPVGSPLDGKPVPRDWKDLDCAGKRRALVAAGLAEDWGRAGRMLGEHGAAVRRFRREKEERRRTGRPGKGGAA